MAFGQLTFRESLHDIEVCLMSRAGQLYHLGIRSHVAHSTLADANANRDWRIYADLDLESTVQADQVVRLRHSRSYKQYPEKLRRIRYYDPETKKTFVFLSNNFVLPADIIALLYRKRWRIELFFKWIKQNLRIKHFYGTSQNAVKTQVWIAVCVYVLVAILRKHLRLDLSLSRIIQVLSVNAFEKEPLQELLTKEAYSFMQGQLYNQLTLWD